jgi:low molecular weight protein-tyrosine phosphatase
MTSILFVCLGNICRSPAAEGMLRKMVQERELKPFHIESRGLGDWHIGQLPDERMREAARDRDIILSMQAQQIKPEDFEEFDHLFAASHTVLVELLQLARTAEQKSKVKLMTAYSKSYPNQDIPDPYYKDAADFELVLDMLEDACHGILTHLT